jgi:hypothetical protein
MGPRGEQGAVGPVGPTGAKGDKGDKGDRGPRGEAGPAGTTDIGDLQGTVPNCTTATQPICWQGNLLKIGNHYFAPTSAVKGDTASK